MRAWENGLLDRLDNAFEPTPDRFHRRFESMLAALQARPVPKPRRFRTRTAVVVALIALLLGATAFALERLGILYFLTQRIAGGMSTEQAEAGIAPVVWQQCESERLSVAHGWPSARTLNPGNRMHTVCSAKQILGRMASILTGYGGRVRCSPSTNGCPKAKRCWWFPMRYCR